MIKQAPTYSPASKQQLEVSPTTESSPKGPTEIMTTEITSSTEDQKDATVHKVSWENFKQQKMPTEGKI